MRFLSPSILLLFKRLSFLLVIYFFLRALFLVGNYGVFQESSFSELAIAFVFGIRFDVVAITIINLPIIIVHLLPDPWLRKTRFLPLINFIFYLLNLPFILANCVDLELFKFSSRRMTADIFSILGLGDDFMATAPKMVADFWIQLVLLIGISVALIVFTRRISKQFLASKSAPTAPGKQIISLASILALSFIGFRGGWQLKPLSILSASGMSSGAETPLLLNSSFTLLKTFGKNQLTPLNYFSAETANRIAPVYHNFSGNSSFQKKNVVILILEGIGKEYIGALSGGVSYTPFIDSLIGHSLVFQNAYANGKRSIEGIPAVTAGIPSLIDLPFISSSYSSNRISSLANLLKPYGYTSFFYHGGTNGTMGFDNFSKVAGYDHYFGRTEYGDEQDYDGNWGIYDIPFLQRSVVEMSKSKSPFHATIFTLSSHHPYAIPDSYRKLFPTGTLPIHQSVRYTDESLRQFFSAASRQPWFSNTLFVITADHTALAEDIFYKTRAGIYAIPMIYYIPGDNLKGKSKRTTQQIDIVPSVLDYLNYPETFFALGTSVFENKGNGFAVNFLNGTYQLIQDNYSFVLDTLTGSKLYSLDKDPLQRTNIYLTENSRGQKMDSTIKAILQQHNRAMIENKMYFSSDKP
jgi:phosphoglycerol transferase MdoB-like AlkP superfamily enzyme